MSNFLDYYRHSHKEHDDVVWGVELSNGAHCYQNPEEEQPSWLTLKAYLATCDLRIVRMWIQFREHIQELPHNKAGYYFAKGAIADFSNPTSECYVLGFVGGDTIYKNWYNTPALQVIENYTEKIIPDKLPLGLILHG